MDTFLVQVWVPADDVSPPDLHGVVRHVTSGDETPFGTEAEILEALRRSGLRGPGEATNHREDERN